MVVGRADVGPAWPTRASNDEPRWSAAASNDEPHWSAVLAFEPQPTKGTVPSSFGKVVCEIRRYVGDAHSVLPLARAAQTTWNDMK